MYKVANRSLKDLEDLFRATAGKKGLNEAVVEKDFWVCLMLDYLFHRCEYKASFTFKGGTSLSKAWNVIERFSEDIDLILDWQTLGYSKDEPCESRSKNKQDKLNKEANVRAEDFIGDKLIELLRGDWKMILSHEHRFEIDPDDHQTILFHYPKIFHSDSLQQTVRLEIGPLAAWVPAHNCVIASFAAEKYPKLFEQKNTTVRTATAERTFWEKITILHKVANFPENKEFPSRYSRHYYDVYCFCKSGYKLSAFKECYLLESVARFKEKFYPSSSAKYDTARIGTLKLMPPQHVMQALKKDYAAMKDMIYGNSPSFDEILKSIGSLEREINNLTQKERTENPMPKFNFIKTSIEGVTIIEPTVYGDVRGYFMETYNKGEFDAAGLNMVFVQDNESRSKKGVLRGLHFQKKNPQGKLVRVIEGEVFDVAVDLRKGSPTFGKWEGVTLSAENKKQFYIPEGFAHGFVVLSETATFVYKCTRLYDPKDEGGLMWNDPAIGIKWPVGNGFEPLLSEKDTKNPALKDLGFAFEL